MTQTTAAPSAESSPAFRTLRLSCALFAYQDAKTAAIVNVMHIRRLVKEKLNPIVFVALLLGVYFSTIV